MLIYLKFIYSIIIFYWIKKNNLFKLIHWFWLSGIRFELSHLEIRRSKVVDWRLRKRLKAQLNDTKFRKFIILFKSDSLDSIPMTWCEHLTFLQIVQTMEYLR